MFDEFSPIGCRQALIDFLEKPLVIINEALHRFFHQCFGGAALPYSHAR